MRMKRQICIQNGILAFYRDSETYQCQSNGTPISHLMCKFLLIHIGLDTKAKDIFSKNVHGKIYLLCLVYQMWWIERKWLSKAVVLLGGMVLLE